MNCKNCNTKLSHKHNFCPNCGAKIINETITLKLLFTDFFNNFLGWDNKYLKSLRYLILKPHVIISDYLNGVRKRYVAPFTFIAIGTAIAMIVFNSFSEQYIDMMSSYNDGQIELMQESFSNIDDSNKYQQDASELKENTIKIQNILLKYFNIFAFVLLPLYAFISFLVFGKKYTYGEHLVINCYIHGIGFIFNIIFFILSIFVYPKLFGLSIISIIFFYLYVYARLLQYNLLQVFLKFLKFLLILIGFLLCFVVFGIIVGIIIAIASSS